MLTLKGIATSPGIARGPVIILDTPLNNQLMRSVKDTEAEYRRVLTAVQTAKKQLTELYKKALNDIGEESAVIFNIHAMMLDDNDFLNYIKEVLEHNSCSGEYAVYATAKHFTSIFNHMEDEYMRERASDIEDLSHRVITVLTDHGNDPFKDISGPVIIAANQLLPSQTFQLDKSRILAFISRKGSMNSHASILARSLGIPFVTALDKEYDQIKTGDYLIVDGTDGFVINEPDTTTLLVYDNKLKELEKEKQLLSTLIGTKATTTDGFSLDLCVNIGHTEEYVQALEMDADGIGLFRSEFLFLESNDFPSEETQFQAYKKVLEKMSPKRVIIRTLDFGADKQAPYFEIGEEDNPALGYRAIRICLDRKDLFVPQLRALLRASVYGHLAIMFPMITGVEEVRQVLTLIASVKEELKADGFAYSDSTEYGIMIETPAAVMVADRLAKEVNFFSIGTNDLTQYSLACDRMNTKVSYLFDEGNISVLRMIQLTVQAAHKHGTRVGICGESAADVHLIPYYVAMGIDELSVSSPYVLKVKEVIQKLSKADCELLCNSYLE